MRLRRDGGAVGIGGVICGTAAECGAAMYEKE